MIFWRFLVLLMVFFFFFFTNLLILCGWSAKQTIPLSVVARNQTNAWARDLDVTGSRQVNASQRVGRRNPERRVGEGRRRVAVGNRQRTAAETSRHEIGSRTCEGRLVSIPRGLRKFRKNYTTAIVYICTGKAVLHNSSSCSWSWPKPLLFFSPTPLIVFLVAIKKCVIPLSEPLDDHWPRFFEEVDVTGAEGVLSQFESIFFFY